MVIKPAHFVAVQSNPAWKRGTATFIAIVAIMSCALVGVPERAQAENCINHTDPNTPGRIACMCSLNIRAACVCGTRMLRGDVIEKDGKCVNYEDYKRTQAREAAASDQAWCSKPHTGETPGQCDKYSTTTPQPKKFKYFRLQTGASFSKNRTNLKTNQRFEATHQRQCWHRTWCAKQCAGYSASGFKCGVRTETNAES